MSPSFDPTVVVWSPHLEGTPPDPGPDTVVVATAPGMAADPPLMEVLSREVLLTGGPVGIGLVDVNGVVVHAGADIHGHLVGLGARDSDSALYRSARHEARLVPPFAWRGPAPELDLSGPLPSLEGCYLGGEAARTSWPWERFVTEAVYGPRGADLAPRCVLVLCSGSEAVAPTLSEVTSAIVRLGFTPVVWSGDHTGSDSDRCLSFGSTVDPAGLAHAFEPLAVVHLDADLLAHPSRCEALLRAGGSAPVALLHGSNGTAASRAEVIDNLEGLESWLAAIATRIDSPSPTSTPTSIDPVPQTTGLVSVVIPVHGRWDLTERCLEALRSSTKAPMELIVVDDASPDDTRARLREQPDVTPILLDENLGFPGAVNCGLRATTGEFVCILNNDTEVTPGWIEEMLAVLATPGTGMVGPRSNRISGLQNVADAPPLARARRAHHWAREWSEGHRGISWRINRLVGFCLLARRDLFEDLGGLDEGFGRGNFEDDELCDRVLGSGLSLRVADGAVVLHHGSATFAGLDDDYLDLLSRAARNWTGPSNRHGGGTAVVVLSDGDPEGAAASAWSVMRLSDEIRIVERAGAHSTALAVARATHLGVEVLAADWRRPHGASAAFAELDSATVLVLEAGEIVSFADLGPTRARLEAIGEPTALDVGGSTCVRICPLGAGSPPSVLEALGEAPTAAVGWLTVARALPGSTAPTAEQAAARTAECPAEATRDPAGPPGSPPVPLPEPSTEPTAAASSHRRNMETARTPVGPVDLRVVVLADSESLPAGLATAASAAPLDPRPTVLVLDSSPEISEFELGDATVSLEDLNWSDPHALGLRLEALEATDALVLQAGEFLVIDLDAWSAELCLLPSGPIGLAVGDRIEVRIHPADATALEVLGAETDIAAGALRIVAPDLPGGPAMAALFPEVATPSAVRAATAGFEPWTEKLAQTLALDEEQRILEQIRRERPISWDAPCPPVGVVVPFAHRHPDSETLARLNATVAAALTQTHPDTRVIVVAPGTADLHSDHEAVQIQHDHSITPGQCPSEMLARLTDLGAALSPAEWVCVIEPGFIPRPDHVGTALAAARTEGAELVSGRLAVQDPDLHWRTLSVDEHLAAGESVSGVVFHAELAALGHHPGSWRLPEGPGRNRLQHLRVLGVHETDHGEVTLARPCDPPAVAPVVNVRPRVPDRGADTGVRLHLGCGPNKFPGWVNVDIEEQYEPELLHDLSEGLPQADATVDLIFSEHFFEHLTLPDGVALMAECRRVLRPGGTLRIAMPDLTTIVEAYGGDWRDQAWLAAYPQIRTAAQMLNTGMRAWEHRYLYDLEDLTLRLTDLGFVDVRPMEWGQSDHPDLRGLETREDSRLIVEAVRP